jgi:hypothetical protein
MRKFNRERWSLGWQDFFNNFTLTYNNRNIRIIVISKEKDGAFAVVDIVLYGFRILSITIGKVVCLKCMQKLEMQGK